METGHLNAHQTALELMGLSAPDQRSAIDHLLGGLPASGWQRIVVATNLADQQLADAVRISISTLTRRKKEGRFTPEESDRLLRFAELVAKASEVFTSRERLHSWFTSPNQQLGGSAPLDYASTSIGAAEVNRVLERVLDGSPA